MGGAGSQAGEGPASAVMEAVKAALLDDLNTPVAISELSAPLKALNDLLHTKAVRRPLELLHFALLSEGAGLPS